MADGKVHSVIFVATENDSVYALDATNPTAGPKHDGVLWHDSFINPAKGITPVSSNDVDVTDIKPNIGITGTPVIDPATNALYLVAKMKTTSKTGAVNYVQKLYALNLNNGSVKNSATLGTTSVAASGQYVNTTAISAAGTGTGSVNGVIQFNALRQDQRAGLALDTNIAGKRDGEIIIAYASHGDINPYHGWVLGYNPRTLQPETTFNTAPNGVYGAIWQGGAAPSIAPNGDIIAATGNATFDAFNSTSAPAPGATALGDSGPGLGYQGLNNSVAISFNAADPSSTTTGTGLYYNGVTPGSAPVAPNVHENLTGTGINFNAAAMAANGPHTFAATVAYNGSTLTEAIKDLTTGALYVHSYANVNIPAAVGGATAYVGFGGSTDGAQSAAAIQSWTFGTAAAPTSTINHAAGFATNSDLTANGVATFAGTAAQLTDGGGEETSTVFANTPVNINNFVTSFTFQFAPKGSGSSTRLPLAELPDRRRDHLDPPERHRPPDRSGPRRVGPRPPADRQDVDRRRQLHADELLVADSERQGPSARPACSSCRASPARRTRTSPSRPARAGRSTSSTPTTSAATPPTGPTRSSRRSPTRQATATSPRRAIPTARCITRLQGTSSSPSR